MRIGSEELFEPPKIDNALRADGDTLCVLYGLQHRAVLHGREENSLASAAKKRQLVCFGAATDEGDAVRIGADQYRNGLAGVLDALPRGTTPAMHRRRVAAVAQGRRHRGRGLR